QWNLSVQKALTRNLVWEVTYVGNHGVKLYGAYEGNQPPPGPGSVNNRRPLAAYTSAAIIRVDPWVSSTYNGFSTRLERRFSSGLSFLGVFTFGRALDTQSNTDLCDGTCGNSSGQGAIVDARNRSLNHGLSDHHIGKRFVFSGAWDLPFGKDGRMLRRGIG